MHIGARFTDELTMSMEAAEMKNELEKEILLKAETMAIVEAELERNPLKEMMLKSEELKCIPCGQNCISSRNCCSPCRCNFGPPVPTCTL